MNLRGLEESVNVNTVGLNPNIIGFFIKILGFFLRCFSYISAALICSRLMMKIGYWI